MPTRRRLLAWLSLAPAVGALSAEASAVLPARASEVLDIRQEAERGVSSGLALTDDGAAVLSGEPAAWSELPFVVAGSLVGSLRTLDVPVTMVTAAWHGEASPGTAVRLDVRGLDAHGLMPWAEAPSGGGVAHLAGWALAIQYRLTLLATDPFVSPVVWDVQVSPVDPAEPAALAEPALTAAQVPPVASHRLYATRIGLIGRTTANGTVIAPEDRFVALPSRRVLAVKGSRDYEVRIDYKGKTTTVPVWDIGPWNVRDNYWDPPARRDMWNDLPPSRPQSAAAYYDAYNGGRDGFGRRVLSPASIDLSDAAFYELGMTNADWVQATMLWQSRR